MNREKIAATLKRIDMSSFPISLRLDLNPVCPDGLTRVSAALRAPDINNVEAAGPRDGFWPAHSMVLADDGDDSIISAARGAMVLALGHEVDEHMKLDGVVFNNPHA